jgi:hypothetical protein
MPDEALLGQDAKHGAHRRVGRRIGQRLHDLGHGRFAAAMQDLHDLPLAAAQVFGDGTLGGHRELPLGWA